MLVAGIVFDFCRVRTSNVDKDGYLEAQPSDDYIASHQASSASSSSSSSSSSDPSPAVYCYVTATDVHRQKPRAPAGSPDSNW